ncbi:MAG: BamA/TamA family outer membrane protein [Bacteroidetes bacterium]|nr:BamA/TamA family outer membrane protein [Bacteroidota bacterium]
MQRAIAAVTFVLAVSAVLRAQDSTSTYVINKIILEGNKVTKSYVILRELPFSEGDTVSTTALEFARERVYSSGLFTNVLMQVEPVFRNRIDLLIYVQERWYIWPYPVVGLRDRDWKKLYVGAGIIHMNFRGRDEKLSGFFALGYDPFFGAFYRTPTIGKNKNFILTLGASYSRGRNISSRTRYSSGEFDDNFGTMYVELGRRFGIYSILTLGAAYNYIAANSSNYSTSVVSPTGTDIFASLNLEYRFDTRNLRSYATQGNYIAASLEKDGLGESAVNFIRFSFDARQYVTLVDPLVFAARIYGDLAEGPQIPPYDHVFIGYYERIRGMFNTISEGESILGANFELHIPIIKKIEIDFPDFPFREYISNRIGIYWSIFADIGETSNKQLNMKINQALYGYGTGLGMLLPYDIVIQADYARGSDKRWQFILDFGATI